jgi:hypothetical protein
MILLYVIVSLGFLYGIIALVRRHENETDRLYERRRQIKNQFEETSYRVELAPGAEIIAHTIHVSNIDCQRAGLTWGEFFRSFWSDPDKTSTTTISVSVTQRFHPVTYPGSAILPDIEDELRQSEWYENSEIYIAPPSRGELVIEIPTTQPPAVASWIETIIDEMKPLLRERDSLNKLTTDHNDTTDLERPESH